MIGPVRVDLQKSKEATLGSQSDPISKSEAAARAGVAAAWCRDSSQLSYRVSWLFSKYALYPQRFLLLFRDSLFLEYVFRPLLHAQFNSISSKKLF